MTEYEKALAALTAASRALADVWTSTNDAELFKAIRTTLVRLDEAREQIGGLAEKEAAQ